MDGNDAKCTSIKIKTNENEIKQRQCRWNLNTSWSFICSGNRCRWRWCCHSRFVLWAGAAATEDSCSSAASRVLYSSSGCCISGGKKSWRKQQADLWSCNISDGMRELCCKTVETLLQDILGVGLSNVLLNRLDLNREEMNGICNLLKAGKHAQTSKRDAWIYPGYSSPWMLLVYLVLPFWMSLLHT